MSGNDGIKVSPLIAGVKPDIKYVIKKDANNNQIWFFSGSDYKITLPDNASTHVILDNAQNVTIVDGAENDGQIYNDVIELGENGGRNNRYISSRGKKNTGNIIVTSDGSNPYGDDVYVSGDASSVVAAGKDAVHIRKGAVMPVIDRRDSQDVRIDDARPEGDAWSIVKEAGDSAAVAKAKDNLITDLQNDGSGILTYKKSGLMNAFGELTYNAPFANAKIGKKTYGEIRDRYMVEEGAINRSNDEFHDNGLETKQAKGKFTIPLTGLQKTGIVVNPRVR